MNLPRTAPTANPTVNQARVVVDVVSLPKMHRLLAQAAQLAAGAGLPPDAFASLAWQAYLRVFPGLAEQLADARMDAGLEELRSSGRLAKA